MVQQILLRISCHRKKLTWRKVIDFFFLILAFLLSKGVKIHFSLDNFKIGTFLLWPGQVMPNVQPQFLSPVSSYLAKSDQDQLLFEWMLERRQKMNWTQFALIQKSPKWDIDFHCTLKRG